MISSCEQFARIASWRMNRLKSSLISFSLIVIVSSFIVAVAGFEPATSPRMGRFANLASRHTFIQLILVWYQTHTEDGSLSTSFSLVSV